MRLVLRCTAISMIIVAPFTFYILWYWDSENLSVTAVSGTYAMRVDDVSATLVLRPDQTFQEQLKASGEVKHAEGKWELAGENHIAFSPELLAVSGRQISSAGTTHADIVKRFGAVWINLPANAGGLSFHKRWFR